MPARAEPCCADSPDSPTFAKPCCADSPNLPTFAEPCCADSPNSPTFVKPFTEYSPDSPTFAKRHFWEKCDSPRHIHTSNSPFSRVWGEWPLLSFFTSNEKGNLIVINRKIVIGYYYHRLLLSEMTWTKVITLSGAYCIRKLILVIQHMPSISAYHSWIIINKKLTI